MKRSKKQKPFVAEPVDYIFGMDFALEDDPTNNWVVIKLLRGDFVGVKYKYNTIGVVGDPNKSGGKNGLHMKMDYDIVDYNGHDKSLDKDPKFNNVVFNIVYAILQMQDLQGQLDDSGRNDIGEPDSE